MEIPFCYLSLDVWKEIALYLNTIDFLRFSAMSKQWRNYLKENESFLFKWLKQRDRPFHLIFGSGYQFVLKQLIYFERLKSKRQPISSTVCLPNVDIKSIYSFNSIEPYFLSHKKLEEKKHRITITGPYGFERTRECTCDIVYSKKLVCSIPGYLLLWISNKDSYGMVHQVIAIPIRENSVTEKMYTIRCDNTSNHKLFVDGNHFFFYCIDQQNTKSNRLYHFNYDSFVKRGETNPSSFIKTLKCNYLPKDPQTENHFKLNTREFSIEILSFKPKSIFSISGIYHQALIASFKEELFYTYSDGQEEFLVRNADQKVWRLPVRLGVYFCKVSFLEDGDVLITTKTVIAIFQKPYESMDSLLERAVHYVQVKVDLFDPHLVLWKDSKKSTFSFCDRRNFSFENAMEIKIKSDNYSFPLVLLYPTCIFYSDSKKGMMQLNYFR